jgi:type I restriction modification DNA specificity family protein
MKKYKLGEIADFNVKAISKSDSLQEIIYLDTSSITENVISDTIIINIEDAPSRAQRRVKNNTIIYSTVRPRLKHYGILNNPQTNFIVSTGFVTIDLKEQYKQIIDPRYLYLLLTQSTITEYIGNIADTAVSAYPSINPADISSLSFNFPSFDLQKSVADIWENYDKKIVLNRQINQNLEAMAKQLYDYWFVQFDFPNEDGKPYKSSDGEMVWNEKLKREIPNGWKDITLNAYIDKNKGGDWGYDTPKEGTIKVGCVRGADIVKLNDVPTRHITLKHYDRLLEDGDIVIEISGGSPVQATGRVALITKGVIERNGGALVCSNFCQSFSMKKRVFSEYFYYLWQSLYDNNNMFNFEGKTSGIKNFQTDVFLANHWFEVPEQLILKFHDIVQEYHSQIDQNIIENNYLTKQRDELLPLLMNGQVSVNSDLSDD